MAFLDGAKFVYEDPFDARRCVKAGPTLAASPSKGSLRRAKRVDKLYDKVLDKVVQSLKVLDYELLDSELLACDPKEKLVTVAADTGAVDNVINIADLSRGSELDGVVQRHFVGASNAHIENDGGCDTMLTANEGRVACKWHCQSLM